MFAPKRAVGGLLLAAIFAAAGCSTARPPLAGVPDKLPVAANGAFAPDAPAEVELPIEWATDSLFVLRHVDPQSPGVLPATKVKDLSFTEVGVMDAVRMLTSQAGLTVRVDGGTLGTERYGSFTMENLSGTFGEVLEEMADAAGFFWELRGRTLIVRQDEQFMVNLPPVLSEDTLAGVTNTLQYLGARDTYLDRAGRTLTFTANRKGMVQIQKYLENIRQTRSLLVYDTHIFHVQLNDGLKTGIEWSAFNGYTRSTNTARNLTLTPERPADASPVSKVALAVANPYFSITTLLSFLSTQGDVKSLSSPQLTMLSGTRGSLRVGETTEYVNKVTPGSTVTSGQTTQTIGSAETAKVKTGLSLQLQGDVFDKTVFTRVTLNISDLVKMDEVEPFIGAKFKLPQTTDRDLDVSIRTRPGDVVLLGGIQSNSAENMLNRGITGFGDSSARERSELVLVLKARVVRFVDKAKVAPAADVVDLVPQD